MMKVNYADKGIPVIIGEYGCPTTNKEPESVRRFLSSVCKAAYDRGLCPVLWSTPGGHYDRDTCKLADQQLKAEFDKITGGKSHSSSTTSETTTTTETTTSATTEATTTTTTVTSTTTTTEETTTTAEVTTVSETTAPETTTTAPDTRSGGNGDANCDGKVDISDAVFIMQSLSNPSKYKLSGEGRKNADCSGGNDGVTNIDALAVQKFLLKIIDALPEIAK